ncbi:hypothetical protein C7293_05985 [filamentous cyanobacterium CCT1]|nr:hypothetical protein C7293_05985 [filamentous cyanobacterium CCT1]PSN81416.1 hypothetical protein C8B47_01190 [filamentous cyanobacterium CCP4]
MIRLLRLQTILVTGDGNRLQELWQPMDHGIMKHFCVKLHTKMTKVNHGLSHSFLMQQRQVAEKFFHFRAHR